MGNTISYDVTEHTVDLGVRGRLRGLQYSKKARRYAGVPYALPPKGEYRWRKPRPLPSGYTYSSGAVDVYDATAFKSICYQPGFGPKAEQDAAHAQYDEDCLFMNIWTPVLEDPSKESKLPVFIWLHGGWFQMGDPSQDNVMDPTELISSGELNAIVISVGYRLNIFGFLSSQELYDESKGQSAGNFGLWDQRLALDWIRENIHLFGGDSGNITLAGRSAGAYGVHAQTLYEFRTRTNSQQPQAFHRLFFCSNAIPAQPKTYTETQSQFDEVCSHFNIPIDLPGPEKLLRLRAIEASDLIHAIKHLKHHTFRPVTDDIFIHPGLIEYHKTGEFARKFKDYGCKLLIGEVLNEETLYSNYNSPEPNAESLHTQVQNYYAESVTDRLLKYYSLPTTNEESVWKTLYGNIIADGQVRAPSRLVVQSLLEHGVDIASVWRYCISYRLSCIDESVAPKEYGVAHAMDKPIWNYSIQLGPNPEEQVFMKTWIRDLVAFVQNEPGYDYGTKLADDIKVATPSGQVSIEKDTRWKTLLELADVFSGV